MGGKILDIGIFEFVNAIKGNNLLLINILLTLGVIFVNGFTDAPNAIATAVCSRCIGLNSAILMAGVFNFLGVLVMTLLNSSVAESISNIVNLGQESKWGLVTLASALFSVVSYGVIAWAFAIPTSESHALISGLTGSAIALRGVQSGVNIGEWTKVIVGLVLSVALGFIVGFYICKFVMLLFKNIKKHSGDIFFKYAGIISAALTSFMHGAQDGQKFMGVIILTMFISKGKKVSNGIDVPLWIILLCAVTLGLGTLCGGRKIIKTVGVDMVRLQKFQAFSSDMAATVSLMVCTVMGCPVSTTHVKTASIIGVGGAVRKSSVNIKPFGSMVLAWMLTFPLCALLSYCVTKLFIVTVLS